MADTELTADERLHLAMQATQNKDSESALTHLKQAIELSPDYAEAYIMLGATYADLSMLDRAEASFKQAILLNPELEVGHFQLGLLYITHGQIDYAKEAWQGLDGMSETSPYRLFKDGMLALAEDNFQDAIELMQKGIEVNHENPALSTDMQRILNSTMALQNSQNTPNIQETSTKSQSANAPRTLSAYEKSNED